jgi:uncharacterized membrane protein (UPF0127 family)
MEGSIEMGSIKVINTTRGTVVAEEVEVADTFWTRLVGLLGRRELSPGKGLMLVPCNAVHGLFMSFDIDVLYVSEQRRVLHILAPLRRFQLGAVIRGSYYVIELPRGTVLQTNTRVGDQLDFIS